jgi:hypothetical protein
MTVRWILGVILLALAALTIAGNIVGGVPAMRARKGFSSVPFLAALLGVIAVIVLPIGSRSWPFAAVLLLDFTVPMALIALARHAFGRQHRDG